MTKQVQAGLVLLVLGVLIKVAAGAGWLGGEIGYAGELTNFGMLILGKELLPASAAMQERRASLAPKAAA